MRLLPRFSSHQDFYPRSPCGERHYKVYNTAALMTAISIHALLAESDLWRLIFQSGTIGFLSTLSLRRATALRDCISCTITISIHALLAESDLIHLRPLRFPGYFYPRSPCGERHTIILPHQPQKVFLSTLSLRRATGGRVWQPHRLCISIHALLAESDLWHRTTPSFYGIFLSTLSLRRATKPKRKKS